MFWIYCEQLFIHSSIFLQMKGSSDISPFGSQCGGKQLLLSMGQTKLLKPYSEKEHAFYEWIHRRENPEVESPFLEVMPKYYGKMQISASEDVKIETTSEWTQHLIETKYSAQQDKQHYLVLQNLLSGMVQPSMLDLKIGIRVKNDKFRQKLKNSTTPTLNFRMCGVKVYQPTKNKTIFKDKYYHQTIGNDQVALNLAHFFYDGSTINTPRITNTIHSIQKIIQAYKQLSWVKIESLSLFLAYDASKQGDQIVAKLIDYDLFKADEENQIDQNRLKGLTNVKICLEGILDNVQQIVEGIQQREDL